VEALSRTPRLIGELLAELATEHGLEAELATKLARYCGLPADALAVTRGDRFPPEPLHVVARCP
jgi:hypothetical protein